MQKFTTLVIYATCVK